MSVLVNPKREVRTGGLVRRLRAFPALGQVKVAPGAKVNWDTLLGEYSSRQRLRFVRVEASDGHISATVLVAPGQKVKRGEVLAYYSFLFGLGFTEYTAPCDGEVMDVSGSLGVIAIKEALVPLRSHMPGRVIAVDDAFGATVEAEGDLVYGVAGVAYGRSGILEIKVQGPAGEIKASDLSAKDVGKVLVAGRSVSQEVLETCLRYRVAGIVAGSVPHGVYQWYKDIAEKLDWDEFLARYWARELKDKKAIVPPPMEISTSLVITEGFGLTSMNDEAFEVLSRHSGEKVFLDGSGAFQSQAAGSDETVPCVFIPTGGEGHASYEDLSQSLVGLAVGDSVKVFRLSGTPVKGKVVEIPGEDVPFDNGVVAQGVKVLFEDGTEKIIPLSNVEKAD